MEPDETMENINNDSENDTAQAVAFALKAFNEICKEKNNPDAPCAGCPLWSICGTLPGSLDDYTIEDTAAAVADYFLEKEEADENAL